jgi:hypothetical protein
VCCEQLKGSGKAEKVEIQLEHDDDDDTMDSSDTEHAGATEQFLESHSAPSVSPVVETPSRAAMLCELDQINSAWNEYKTNPTLMNSMAVNNPAFWNKWYNLAIAVGDVALTATVILQAIRQLGQQFTEDDMADIVRKLMSCNSEPNVSAPAPVVNALEIHPSTAAVPLPIRVSVCVCVF